MARANALLLATMLLTGAPALASAGSGPPPYLGVRPAGNAKDAASTVKNTCSACHGMHGNSMSAEFPNLAGQNYNYLLKQLEDFTSGKRKASPMSQLVKSLGGGRDGKKLQDLAAWFAAAKLDRAANANARETKPPEDAVARGYDIFHQGIARQQVPACSACHLPTGTGMAPMAIPALAGQHATYVQSQLQRFADGKRGNSPHHIMQLIAKRLDAKQMHEVALYVQAMNAASLLGTGPRNYHDYVARVKNEPVPGIPASDLASGSTKQHVQAKKSNATN